MRRAVCLRPLTPDETSQLRAGLLSPKAYTLRRCQILLASAGGHSKSDLATIIGCTTPTVSKAIIDFHARGIASVHAPRDGPESQRHGALRIEEREPGITAALGRLLTAEVAGDPMGGPCWVRSSLRKLRDALGKQGFKVDHCTVRKLLRGMGFTLKRNQKRRGGSQHAGRDEQFRYIGGPRSRPRVYPSSASTPRRRS